MESELIRAVRRFFERPDIHGRLELLRRRLPGAAELYIAGGAPRNVVIAAVHGKAPPTRDIDIFIGGLDRGFSLSEALYDEPTKPTDLKGLRWQPDGSDLVYDLSLLPDFFVIDAYRLDPTLGNFLQCIDFTINAIVFDGRRRMLHEAGCIDAVRARTIAFHSRLKPDKLLLAYRILLMAHKTGFRLAEPVFDFVRYGLELDTVRRLKGLLRAKAGKAAAADIMAAYDSLCRRHSYGDYCRAYDMGTDGDAPA